MAIKTVVTFGFGPGATGLSTIPLLGFSPAPVTDVFGRLHISDAAAYGLALTDDPAYRLTLTDAAAYGLALKEEPA